MNKNKNGINNNGMGLGLSLAQKLMSIVGGEIKLISSSSKKGT